MNFGPLCAYLCLIPCCCCCCVASVVSDSVRPHRWQPSGLLCPWDSPGKNTGVGCRFLLPCMKVKSESEICSVVPDCLRPHGLQPTRLLRPWDFPGKSTGVGCHDEGPEFSLNQVCPLFKSSPALSLGLPRWFSG